MWMVYPERRFMDSEKIISWANDLLADVGDAPVNNLTDAVFILEDMGMATFVYGEPPTTVEHELQRLGF